MFLFRLAWLIEFFLHILILVSNYVSARIKGIQFMYIIYSIYSYLLLS